jgi:hypothetical protein
MVQPFPAVPWTGLAFGLIAALALLAPRSGACETPAGYPDTAAWTFTLENDVFTGSDNNYTNGLGLSWVSSDLDSYDESSFLRKWGRFWSFLPFVEDAGYKTYAAWSLVQEMNTPNDIDNPNPPLDDQPYSGMLYIDSVLYARGDRWTHAWELKLGVVGPASRAEHTQKDFHHLVGADEPQGWDTQLPNEGIINVGYTVAHLLKKGEVGKSAEWRLVPVASASLGNYFTGVGLGMYGEIGWNLVDALGGTALREGMNAASTVGVGRVEGWSVGFFGGLGGYGVAHYLPLDGTVFHDSRSVDSEPLVGMTSVGMNVRHHGLVVSLATTFYTDTFKTQRKDADFGTLSVSWQF